ncbi:MAG TPA: hypothetical protein VMU06_01325 [Stellaceae bacterium]|nr:hypothetical protein [Stellaceae bacterium]
MLALTPPRRAFVRAKVLFGVNNKKAAEMAGYSPASSHALENRGYQLAHDPLIQEALREESVKMMRSEGIRSLHTLINLRDDASVAPRERLRAAVEIMNRCGLHAVTEAHVSVEHRMTDVQKDRRILALAAELGLSDSEAKKLLIAPLEATKIADAEFTVVEPATDEERAAAAKREKHAAQERARYHRTPEQREAHRRQVNEQRRQRGKHEYAEQSKARSEAITFEGLEDVLDLPSTPDTAAQE